MKAQIIVASDTHGNTQDLMALEGAYPKADVLIHCGDLEDDKSRVRHWVLVRGNNDWDYDLSNDRVINVAGHRILITHSHLYGYNKREAKLADKAKSLDCDIVCYGHTHVGYINTIDGVLIVNPGSMTWPRDGKEPSYAEIEIDDNGTAHARLIYKKDWPFVRQNQSKRRWFWQ